MAPTSARPGRLSSVLGALALLALWCLTQVNHGPEKMRHHIEDAFARPGDLRSDLALGLVDVRDWDSRAAVERAGLLNASTFPDPGNSSIDLAEQKRLVHESSGMAMGCRVWYRLEPYPGCAPECTACIETCAPPEVDYALRAQGYELGPSCVDRGCSGPEPAQPLAATTGNETASYSCDTREMAAVMGAPGEDANKTAVAWVLRGLASLVVVLVYFAWAKLLVSWYLRGSPPGARSVESDPGNASGLQATPSVESTVGNVSGEGLWENVTVGNGKRPLHDAGLLQMEAELQRLRKSPHAHDSEQRNRANALAQAIYQRRRLILGLPSDPDHSLLLSPGRGTVAPLDADAVDHVAHAEGRLEERREERAAVRAVAVLAGLVVGFGLALGMIILLFGPVDAAPDQRVIRR